MNYYPQYQPIQYQQQYTPTIMTLQSEEEALKYPIAPGNSIMFKIENQPLIIEKSMGLSQLDSPMIKYIDLVPRTTEQKPDYALKEDLEQIREDIKALQDKLVEKRTRKKEVEENV